MGINFLTVVMLNPTIETIKTMDKLERYDIVLDHYKCNYLKQ